MTPSPADHAQMSVEDFEQIARTAPKTVKLEFVNGKLEVKPVPDGDHDEIVLWLQTLCMQHRPELGLYAERGLRIEAYRKGRAVPDGVLAPRRHFVGHGLWSDPEGVLMVVEVTSYDSDTDRRDRNEKRDGYAAAGIPVYLLIDRDNGTLTVYSEPLNGVYQRQPSYPFGTDVQLPEPASLTLETEELTAYIR
ncbi:Uma2 family endonuclease [Streptomyces liangshanensis]|uniref:Uma2 family endonuclease n=1 Tax=Streptomyces liangshanensis TaxID=2717324 RepID=A0A6G9H0X1_9ACTN|nr:Uma2 family endonuclease [Streptomyces liangshanensis]QIQ04183.1 Uma2 family endonuclease [Streptomyces liangshanensis]